MRVLILGGNRFVGKQLGENLLAKGYKVHIFNRSGTGPKGATILKGDRNTYRENFIGYDLVIDFCLFKPEQAERIIKQLPGDQRYIFISSAAAYQDAPNLAYKDTSTTGGLEAFAPYGAEKAECENIINNSTLRSTILRPPYLDGPGSHRPRLAYYFNQILNNKPVHVDGDGEKLMTFLWAEDFVNILSKYVEDVRKNKTLPKEKAVVGPDIYTSKSLIKEVANYLKKAYLIEENGTEAPFPNAHLILTSDFKLKPLKEKLDQFYKWFNTEGKKQYGYK